MADVFISHSSVDKEFARRLAHDLVDFGHTPWLDEWDIHVGECIVSKIERAIGKASFVGIILTKEAVQSGWVDREWKAKYWQEISQQRTMILPILLKECDIPLLLQTKKYADFRSNYEMGLVNLLRALSETNRLQAKFLADAARLGVSQIGQGEHTEDFQSLVAGAQDEIMFVYLSGGDQIRRNFESVTAWCASREHRRVRLLGLNPDNENLVRAVAATSGKGDVDLYKQMMRDTIRRFSEFRNGLNPLSTNAQPRVEQKVHNAAPFATITIADQESKANGKMYVELYAYGQSWSKRPFLILDAGQELFETYRIACNRLWRDAIIVE